MADNVKTIMGHFKCSLLISKIKVTIEKNKKKAEKFQIVTIIVGLFGNGF